MSTEPLRRVTLACYALVFSLLVIGGCASNPREDVTESELSLSADPRAVWTQHFDNARTGAVLTETSLNTANVNASGFGKLFTRPVDGQIYAQPLYLAGVTMGGRAHNVVYVATVNDTVYAFDAEDPTLTAPLLARNLLDVAPAGARPVRNTDVGQVCVPYVDFSGNLGIVGTPVIDVANDTMYLVARSREPNGFVQRLHALDITTLADRPSSPVVIEASVPGSGSDAIAGRIAFNPETHNQRAALTLSRGVVYIAWASHCDTGPYHGWVIGYDTRTLRQSFAFNVTADGSDGGIWQAGQGLAADEQGYLYFLTGDGVSNAQYGGGSYASTFIKLDPTRSSPLVDWFMPYNVRELNENDMDLGSSGALLIPGTDLLVGGGKQGKLYLLNRNDLGRYQPDSDSQVVQSFQATAGHIHGSPVYWESEGTGKTLYVWSENDYLKAFSFDGSSIDPRPRTSTIRVPAGMPGAMLTISANGGNRGSGLVWASHPTSGDANHMTQPGTLRAFDAQDVSRELWNSNMNFERDRVGNFAKFVPPVVANGRVYLATFSDELAVYGLLASTSHGLHAEYFNDLELSAPALERTDAVIDFDWGVGSPDPAILPDRFSVRWTGRLVPRFSEEYTFTTTSDDGVRLWVNGVLLVDKWWNHPPQQDQGTLSLLAGREYDLRMELYENTGEAVARLVWSSASQPAEVVPTSQLTPAASRSTGVRAEYFDGLDFSGARATRVDARIDFDWNIGAPLPSMGVDEFSVRWSGAMLAPFSETYTFTATSDDGVRLWIDDALVIDDWNDHPRHDKSESMALVAGRHALRMEFYENTGEAVAQLSWSSPSIPRQVVPSASLSP